MIFMNVEKTLQLLKKEYPNSKYYLNFSNPLELMVAAILSAQVRDTVVNAVTPRLFKKYKSAKDYAGAGLKDLENATKSIPFYKNKCKNIKESCKILAEKHGGHVPKTMEELTKLPGIGRKTANAILSNAYGIVNGIVVDTHVIRLSYRLGWTKNKNPEKIEEDLMNIIPKKEWESTPHLLKDHGRAICKAPVPECSKCILNNICPKNGVTKSL
jgi:endonuclease-3